MFAIIYLVIICQGSAPLGVDLSPTITDSRDLDTFHAGFTRCKCFHVFFIQLTSGIDFYVNQICLLLSVSHDINGCIHGTCYSKRYLRYFTNKSCQKHHFQLAVFKVVL